jgi:DNA-binding NarL/FixJ family response regulator
MASFDSNPPIDKGIPTRERHRVERLLALVCEGHTALECAAKMKMGERTVHRYLKDESFQRLLKDSSDQLHDQTIFKLTSSVNGAISTLVEIHTDRSMPPASRVTAAARIIQMAYTFGPVGEIEERLRQLERTNVVEGNADWK